MGILLPFFLLMGSIRHLTILAPFSTVGIILLLAGFIICFRFIFVDLPSPDTRPYVANFAGYPVFFGIAVFAFEGIGVVSTLSMWHSQFIVLWAAFLA